MGKHRRDQDHFGRRAKKEGYAARSVYKLAEIQQRYRVLSSGDQVVDLGCYPGSWSQYAHEHIGKRGSILGIDLKAPELTFPSNVQWIEGSVLELDPKEVVTTHGLKTVVLSDMAPSTTGVRLVDQLRSHELARVAFEWSLVLLRPSGCLVLKLFQGPDTPELIREAKRAFDQARTFKPQGSRRESMETFLIAMGRKEEPSSSEAG